MVERLGKLGDRLLTRLVPKVDADAAQAACFGYFCTCRGRYPLFTIRIDGPCELCTAQQC